MSKRSLFSILGIIIVILIAGFLVFLIYWDSIKEKIEQRKSSREEILRQEFLKRGTSKGREELSLQELQEVREREQEFLKKGTSRGREDLSPQELQEIQEKEQEFLKKSK